MEVQPSPETRALDVFEGILDGFDADLVPFVTLRSFLTKLLRDRCRTSPGPS